ncbi:hypothetical protein D3C86_2115300 [compost metagenome]
MRIDRQRQADQVLEVGQGFQVSPFWPEREQDVRGHGHGRAQRDGVRTPDIHDNRGIARGAILQESTQVAGGVLDG